MKIAVQLYTLRDSFTKDLWGTFDKLAQCGFKNVELAGNYDLSDQELADGLTSRGLHPISSHISLETLEKDPHSIAQSAKTLGFTYVAIPWLSIKDFPGGWKEVGQRSEAIGQSLKPHGIQTLYHNHDFEFEMEGDQTGHQILFAQTTPKNVAAELDLYWIKKANHDPVTLINHFKNRLPIAHFKDMDPNSQSFTEVGSGILDWDTIIPTCQSAGTQYAVIENDQPQIDPIESVRISREFLLNKGLKD